MEIHSTLWCIHPQKCCDVMIQYYWYMEQWVNWPLFQILSSSVLLQSCMTDSSINHDVKNQYQNCHWSLNISSHVSNMGVFMIKIIWYCMDGQAIMWNKDYTSSEFHLFSGILPVAKHLKSGKNPENSHILSLQWRHNEHDGVSNHHPHDCLLKCLFRSRSKKTSKLLVTGLCERNSPVTGEFPAQRASNVEDVSIWWGHHVCMCGKYLLSNCKDCNQSSHPYQMKGNTIWHQEVITYPH